MLRERANGRIPSRIKVRSDNFGPKSDNFGWLRGTNPVSNFRTSDKKILDFIT